MRAKLFEILIWWCRPQNRKGLIWYVQFGIWLKGFTNWTFLFALLFFCSGGACFVWLQCCFFTQHHSNRSSFFISNHIPAYANGLLWPSQSWNYQYKLWPEDPYTHINVAVMWKLQVRWVASKFDACHLSVYFAFFLLLRELGNFLPHFVLLSFFGFFHAGAGLSHTILNDHHTIPTHIETTTTANWATLQWHILCIETRIFQKAIFSNNKLWPIYLTIFLCFASSSSLNSLFV